LNGTSHTLCRSNTITNAGMSSQPTPRAINIISNGNLWRSADNNIITLNNISLSEQSSDGWSAAIFLQANVSGLSVSNNLIEGNTFSAGSHSNNSVGVFYEVQGGSTANNNTFSANQMSGLGHGLVVFGTAQPANSRAIANTFTNVPTPYSGVNFTIF